MMVLGLKVEGWWAGMGLPLQRFRSRGCLASGDLGLAALRSRNLLQGGCTWSNDLRRF